jgi:hypothetical protein
VSSTLQIIHKHYDLLNICWDLVALLWRTTKSVGLEGNHEQHGMREFTGKQALLGLFRRKQGESNPEIERA